MRVFIEVYGWLAAGFLLALFESARLTSQIEIVGEEHLLAHPHAIWASWHEFLVCAFVTLPMMKTRSNPQIWLNHPAWIMRPVHRVMGYYGVGIIMGASGERGRESAAELLLKLKQGASTSINPDGPAGPKHSLKNGVLMLARESEIPVLAISYSSSRFWYWPGWDKKIVPFPFSKIRVHVSPPMFVKDDLEGQNGDQIRLTEMLCKNI